MKTLFGILLFGSILLPAELQAQRIKGGKDRDWSNRAAGIEGIADRAGGAHNKSNIGAFFENRGKLYARNLATGVSGEFPTGSLHEYIYRVNPYVGLPGSVIQGRFMKNEEWEAAAGYSSGATIAFSDKPNSWPASGWPVKDPSGKPVFVSNQDSYCVYNDSNNTRKVLGIQINQTGYAFSQKSIRDLVFFIFQVTNRSKQTYDSVYFGFYLDLDIGGYNDEYGDDRYVFDKKWNRVYGYDVDGWSSEWNAPTGVFGGLLLQTPKVNGVEVGLTDLHYCTYDDDNIDDDNTEFGRMSSAPSLYASNLGPKYFHLGANTPNLHFDDFSTQPAAGLDPTAIMSSGPYRLAPGDTLKFITALIAGNTVEEMDSTTVHAYALLADNFVVTQPPVTPKASISAADRKVTVTWDNRSESSQDPLTGKINFEGYRVYKSIDKGQHWDQIDRNYQPNTGADPVPLATFDRVDGYGKDSGLQYSLVDTNVTNGFEYWYAVTAYSTPDVRGNILESARGTSTEDMNLVVAVPRSAAIGRIPVTATTPQQTGTGTSRVVFDIRPFDSPDAGGRTYEVSFAPVVTIEQGTPRSLIQVSIDASGPKTSETFSMAFTSPSRYVLRNLTEGTVLDTAGVYQSGVPILIEGVRLLLTDTSSLAAERPKLGDSLTIKQGVQVMVGSQGGLVSIGTPGVLPLLPFFYGVQYSTTTGVVFAVQPADSLVGSRITYNDRFTFTTTAAGASRSITDADLNRVKVVPNPYLVASQYEPEFGIIRREPIRELKFNNLPSRCTIYIFNVAGDKVQTIEHNSDNGTEPWDLRAAGGREIAPGIYLYLVKTDTAQKLGRFAVIK